MHLWNEYEGKTLAGGFTLGKLLRTEGRSASFETRTSTGKPAVLRLTEALNDQQEINERYASIQAAAGSVAEAHLVTIEKFGETEFDGTPLTYVLMEPTQESLADIVAARKLGTDETAEVAASVVAALEALHSHNLVHGQVEAGNVLAAGDVIKLRSDCARRAPEGADGERIRNQDVLGLSGILYRALTQNRLEEVADALVLPEPYASIVRNTMRGTWGLREVAAEVARHAPRAASVASVAPAASPVVPPGGSAAAPSFSAELARANAAYKSAAEPASESKAAGGPARGLGTQGTVGQAAVVSAAGADAKGRPAVKGTDASPQLPLNYAAQDKAPALEPDKLSVLDDDKPSSWQQPDAAGGISKAAWAAIAVAALVVVLVVAYFARSSKAPSPSASQQSAAQSPAAQPAASPVPTPAVTANAVPSGAKPSAAKPPGRTAMALAAPVPQPLPVGGSDDRSSGARSVWRVVAYTYHRESQAQAKAQALAQQHAALNPQVFSPTGGSPFLVTLGGPMAEAQARSLREHARSLGLARDMYVQNYSH